MDHLLLGFDATPAAWEALDWAARLAAVAGADFQGLRGRERPARGGGPPERTGGPGD